MSQLGDTLRERRGRRQRPIADLDDFDDLYPSDLDLPSSPPEPPAAHPARSRPELAVDAEVLTLPEAPVVVPDQQPNGADRATGSAAVAAPTTAPTTAPAPSPATPPVPTRRGKRASVPSWDDIVFGGRRE